MSTINIVAKDQGQPIMRLLDEPWQNLLQLDGGTFNETETFFEFITTGGKKVFAIKNDVYKTAGQRITYMGSMDELGGPQILIDQHMESLGMFIIRGFYAGSFMVAIHVKSTKQENQNIKYSEKNNGMKKKLLNDQQLALLSTAYMKRLFPVPKTGQCLVEDDDNGCCLYFEGEYYRKLTNSIHEKFNSGSFAASNAEPEWNDLMFAIDNAEVVRDDFDISSLRTHFLSED